MKKINELENELEAKKQRFEGLEADSSKFLEAEESLLKAREEISALTSELAQHRTLDLESRASRGNVSIPSRVVEYLYR